MKRSRTVVLLALLAGALALATAGCGGDDGGAGEGTGATDAEGFRRFRPSRRCPRARAPTSSTRARATRRSRSPPTWSCRDPRGRRTLQIVEAIRQMLDSSGWKARWRRLPVVRRLDGTGRQVGSGQVQPERERLRREPVAPGRNRHVQLGLRRGRAAGAEPGAGWKPRHGLAGEHVRVPHRRRAGVRRRRARSVLPDGRAQLRPCGRTRRLPGRGPRPVHAGAGDDEALHPQRPRGLRAGRRHERQGAAEHLGIEVVGFEAWDRRRRTTRR